MCTCGFCLIRYFGAILLNDLGFCVGTNETIDQGFMGKTRLAEVM